MQEDNENWKKNEMRRRNKSVNGTRGINESKKRRLKKEGGSQLNDNEG